MSDDVALERQNTTVRFYDPKVKAEAYDKFLNTDMDIIDIAIAVGIPKQVVAAWSKEGGWLKRKEELELEFMRSAESKFRTFIIEHKLPTMIRHLELSRKIEEALGVVLDEAKTSGKPCNSTELRRLAEALSSATAVSALVMNITEKAIAEQPKAQEPRGKSPLVAIAVGSGHGPMTVTADDGYGETETINI
jgi:hypothetical protein